MNSSPEYPPNKKSLESDDSLDLKGTTDNADIQSKAADTVGEKSKFSVNHSYEGSENSFSNKMAKYKCRPKKKFKRRGKRTAGTRPELGAIVQASSKRSLNIGSRNDFDLNPKTKIQSEDYESGDVSQMKVRRPVKRQKDSLRAGSRYDLGIFTPWPVADGLLSDGLR